MKKILKIILTINLAFILTSCEDISDIAKATGFGDSAEEIAMVNELINKYGDITKFTDNKRVLEARLTTEIIEYIPVDTVSSYNIDSDEFIVWFVYDDFEKDTITVDFIYEDADHLIHSFETETGEDYGRAYFTLEAPDTGWVLGDYQVKITSSKVSETIDFSVTEGKTKASPLFEEGTVDLGALEDELNDKESKDNDLDDLFGGNEKEDDKNDLDDIFGTDPDDVITEGPELDELEDFINSLDSASMFTEVNGEISNVYFDLEEQIIYGIAEGLELLLYYEDGDYLSANFEDNYIYETDKSTYDEMASMLYDFMNLIDEDYDLELVEDGIYQDGDFYLTITDSYIEVFENENIARIYGFNDTNLDINDFISDVEDIDNEEEIDQQDEEMKSEFSDVDEFFDYVLSLENYSYKLYKGESISTTHNIDLSDNVIAAIKHEDPGNFICEESITYYKKINNDYYMFFDQASYDAAMNDGILLESNEASENMYVNGGIGSLDYDLQKAIEAKDDFNKMSNGFISSEDSEYSIFINDDNYIIRMGYYMVEIYDIGNTEVK